MDNAIYPITDTYLTLMPLELRQLLYLYINIGDIEYDIDQGFQDFIVGINIPSKQWYRTVILVNKQHVKKHKTTILHFINELKSRMMYKGSQFSASVILTPMVRLELLHRHTIAIKSLEQSTTSAFIVGTTLPMCIPMFNLLSELVNKASE